MGSPLPRARGGISATGQPSGIITISSPRTRGYFWLGRTEARHGCLFPAHAGVFPVAPSDRAACVPLPRARGGISVGKNVPAEFEASSPRTRGYFCGSVECVADAWLFPAHAGVFPIRKPRSPLRTPLPRTRGGISRFWRHRRAHRALFPAHAGVFPGSQRSIADIHPLPRARGGISGPAPTSSTSTCSSPRTRGYFALVLPRTNSRTHT